MKKKVIGIDPLNIVILFTMISSLIGLYIFFYRREQFKYIIEEIIDFIFFSFNLILVNMFDKMFAYRCYYERKRKVGVTNTVSYIETVHSGRLPESKRINGRSKSVVKKNR